jgi:uncharacterized protein
MLPVVSLPFQMDILAQKVETAMRAADVAHDFLHIQRVRKLARQIGEAENANLEMVDIVALLHDVGDRSPGSARTSPSSDGQTLSGTWKVLPTMSAADFLPDHPDLPKILNMIKATSWSSGDLYSNLSSENQLTVAVVADADRLEAMGAIGIARCLSYSGAHSVPVFTDKPPRIPCPLDQYKSEASTSATNHFFEKLLTLDQSVRTQTGKMMAKNRKARMINFLLDLAEETGWKYPITTLPLLHIAPEVTTFGSTIAFALDYTPATVSAFQKAIFDTYKVGVAVSGKSFMISAHVTNLFELIWKTLPNPRVCAVLEKPNILRTLSSDVGEVSTPTRSGYSTPISRSGFTSPITASPVPALLKSGDIPIFSLSTGAGQVRPAPRKTSLGTEGSSGPQ